MGSPMMLMMRPRVCSPTGTLIGAPVSATLTWTVAGKRRLVYATLSGSQRLPSHAFHYVRRCWAAEAVVFPRSPEHFRE
eukprot:10897115-Alexandrium_andersonii.AAC.1